MELFVRTGDMVRKPAGIRRASKKGNLKWKSEDPAEKSSRIQNPAQREKLRDGCRYSGSNCLHMLPSRECAVQLSEARGSVVGAVVTAGVVV